MQYYHNCTINLVHTVSDFSPGVATVWTHRDHTVATLASTALNRYKSCWTGVHRDVAPVVSKFLNRRDSLGCETTPAYSGASL